MSLVSYYLCGHQDDWQLFRGEQAAVDIAVRDTRVVFIYSTAGELNYVEAGIDPADLWPIREQAAMASLQALVPGSIIEDEVLIAGKTIVRKRLGNTTSYFLRLPQGTRQLRHRYQATIETVDKRNSYTWPDVVRVLRSLLDAELATADSPAWVNYAACDEDANSGSNTDHYDLGVAFEAGNEDGAYRQVGWIDYRIEDDARFPRNLTDDQIAVKLLLTRDSYFTVIQNAFGFDDYTDSNYQRWISKSYIAGADGPVNPYAGP